MPSKIPVGFFRVEEEKRINRALSRDRSGMTKMIRERSMSRIPVFSNRSPYHVIINTVYYTLCILYVGIFAAYKYLIELQMFFIYVLLVLLYRSLRRACKRVVAEEGSKTTPEASPPGDPGPSKTKCHRVQQHPAPSKRSEQKQGT